MYGILRAGSVRPAKGRELHFEPAVYMPIYWIVFICDIIGLTKLQESSAEAIETTIKAEASESQSNHFETFERLRRAHCRR